MGVKTKRKTITNRLDKLCSLVTRSKGKCERCGTDQTLQTHHVYGRANRRLRWDLRNLTCLCAGDHFWAETHPLDFADWFRAVRPEDAIYLQAENARGIRKWSEAELEELELDLKDLLASR